MSSPHPYPDLYVHGLRELPAWQLWALLSDLTKELIFRWGLRRLSERPPPIIEREEALPLHEREAFEEAEAARERRQAEAWGAEGASESGPLHLRVREGPPPPQHESGQAGGPGTESHWREVVEEHWRHTREAEPRHDVRARPGQSTPERGAPRHLEREESRRDERPLPRGSPSRSRSPRPRRFAPLPPYGSRYDRDAELWGCVTLVASTYYLGHVALYILILVDFGHVALHICFNL